MSFENDPDGYRMAQGYAGHDFDKPRVVAHQPLYAFRFNYSLSEFQKIVADAVASIPEEYRASSSVDLESHDHDVGSEFSITYFAPESAKAVAGRIKRCEEYVANKRLAERSEYDRLSIKFAKPCSTQVEQS